MLSVIAIIVARGGSQRLPGKALRPFGDSTLLGHKIDTLNAASEIDRIIVGSDSPDILAEAIRHGAMAVRRDVYHCDESRTSANEMIADMLARVDCLPNDLIVWAHPTNPLILPGTYDAAVQAFAAGRPEHDSLCSVMRIQRHAWHAGHPLNFDPSAPRHQFAVELAPVLVQDGAIFIQPAEQMRGNRYFYGLTPLLFEIDQVEGIDIDTPRDYAAALALRSVMEVSRAA